MGWVKQTKQGHKEAKELAEFHGVSLSSMLSTRLFSPDTYQHIWDEYLKYKENMENCWREMGGK